MPFLAYTSDWAMTPSERDISGLCESEVASVGLISLSHSSKLDTAKKISTGKPYPSRHDPEVRGGKSKLTQLTRSYAEGVAQPPIRSISPILLDERQ
jgi:hypothetical protein